MHAIYYHITYLGHFVMVPLNLTFLHCLQHSFFDFSLIYILKIATNLKTSLMGQQAILLEQHMVISPTIRVTLALI